MPIEWPGWGVWELELSSHLLKRMAERDFNEVDLRQMLQNAFEYLPDVEVGRWMIRSKHRRRLWKIIVEPDFEREVLVIVTAFPASRDKSR
jgi:hypothetical protein